VLPDRRAPRAAAAWQDEPTVEFEGEAPAMLGVPAARLGVGVKLRGRYVLESLIGVGGTANVYRARDVRRERGAPFAFVDVKVPRQENAERLKREFRIAQSLSHPNIVRVFDLDRVGGIWFMVTELLEGETLLEALERASPGGLPPPLGARVLRACAQALQFAHDRGIVHGDFKPGNVLVARAGEPRVLDFGASVSQDPRSRGNTNTLRPAATRRYASPQVLAGEPPEPADDIFSFACVACEVLSGAHPFGQLSSTEARAAKLEPTRPPTLSAAVWQSLRPALAWERAARPATVRELAVALGLESRGATEGSAERVMADEPWWMRTPVLGAALAAASAIVLAIAWAGFGADQARESSLPDTSATRASDAAEIRERSVIVPGVSSARNDASVVSLAMSPAPTATREAAPQRGSSASHEVSAVSTPPAAPAAGSRVAEVSFDSEQVSVTEGAIAAAIILTRTGDRSGVALARWRLAPQSADTPADFGTEPEGTVRFAEGQTRRVLYVPLHGDTITEPDETFVVELFGTRGAKAGAVQSVTVRIHDDDGN
jgi:hypothetical protein